MDRARNNGSRLVFTAPRPGPERSDDLVPQTARSRPRNPRHARVRAAWPEAKIPGDKVLVPGVLDSTTN